MVLASLGKTTSLSVLHTVDRLSCLLLAVNCGASGLNLQQQVRVAVLPTAALRGRLWKRLVSSNYGNAAACNYRHENGKLRAPSFRHEIALTVFDTKRKPT